MRIATFNAYENVITNLQSRQRGLQHSQEQLTSGKRVSKPSDDPVAAARAERRWQR
jgi:flagellar hook-associated protein 3 FlgL